MTKCARTGVATALGLLLALLAAPSLADQLDHRDDYAMNFISGGDFRQYISEHVEEQDLWAHSIRVFGTFHNHMHELMTDLARYDRQSMHPDNVPDIDQRISGGQWTEYRQAIEQDGHPHETWKQMVQITEIMHDRVHHAMLKATVYDHETRQRDVDLSEYLDPERSGHEFAQTLPGADQRNLRDISRAQFREFAWHWDFDDPHLHAAVQKMMVFDEMLHDLMHQWAEYGSRKAEQACQPPVMDDRITSQQWRQYADAIQDCDDDRWREMVQVAGLMHDRIRHMMYKMVLHDATVHDRQDQFQQLLDQANDR